MNTTTANNLVAGQTVIIAKRAYKVMGTTINFGAFGDNVVLNLLDIAKDRYTQPQTFGMDAQFEVAA